MSISTTLLEEISSIDFLHNAWRLLNKSNKDSKGLSNLSVKDFESNLPRNIRVLSESLQKGTFKFAKVKGATIKKKNNDLRPLRISEIQDRIVHKALAVKLEELLSKKYQLNNPCSFAYQRGKSIQDAIVQMNVYFQQGYKIILEADIQKFFDSVDTKKLLSEIESSLKDTTINSLLQDAVNQELGNIEELKQKKVYEEYFLNSESGIPQGNSLSPLLANIYLSPFDQKMISLDIKMIRYADDFIIMSKDTEDAKKAFLIAKDELEGKLSLKLYPLKDEQIKDEKISRILDPRQHVFSFLSIRFDGFKCWVKEKKVLGLFEKISALTSREELYKEYPKEDIGLLQALIKIKNLLEGWIAAYHFLTIENQLIEIDKHVNIRLYQLFTEFKFNLHKDDLVRISFKGRSNSKWGLSDNQRKFSGVPVGMKILARVRAGKPTLRELIVYKTSEKSMELQTA